MIADRRQTRPLLLNQGVTSRKRPCPHERIEINPDIMGGKPVVRGTHVPVKPVLRELGAGIRPSRSLWIIRG